jgi:hypothetical protein
MRKKPIKSAFYDKGLTKVLEQNGEILQTDFVNALKAALRGDSGYTPVKGKDYFTPYEIQSFKAEILAGATPKKFKDYFTEKEILYVMSEVRKMIVSDLSTGLKEELKPVKGVDYNDGAPADEVKIISSVLKEVEKTYPKAFDPKAIIKDIESIRSDIKDRPTTESLLKEIKSKKLIDRKDINGMPLKEQKWHGGGPLVTVNGQPMSPLAFSNINFLAGPGISITTADDTSNSRVNFTITATGGATASIASQAVTGTQVGDDLEVDLTQLSNPYTAVLQVVLNGQILDLTRWSIVADTMTITNAYTSDSVQLLYTY